MQNKSLIIFYIVSAALFMLFKFNGAPVFLVASVKALPALCIAYAFFQRRLKPYALVMSFGFFASACGDVFLDVSPENLFIAGLISFLVAHICYTIFFWKHSKRSPIHIPATILILTFTSTMMYFLWSGLGNLLVPVLFYVVALALMAIASARVSTVFPGLFMGAFIFVISDSLLAWNKFMGEWSGARILILLTYFSGNFLIGYHSLKLVNEKALPKA